MRPLTYYQGGTILGHYAVAQRSGEIAATLSAGGLLASIRNSHASQLIALMRIKIGISISGAVTTAVEFAFSATTYRGFSVDFTTASTPISMAAVANTNKMRASMGTSMLGTVGPRICTTATMSGQTATADAAPFACASVPMLQPVTATGTAVALPVGAASPMVTLYEWTGLGQHPVILGSNEGVVIRNMLAGPASGTFALYAQWEWAEVVAF